MRWVLSFLFVVQMYAMMAILALYYTPLAVVDRRWASAGIRAYCRYVRWSAHWMVGLRSEVRGKVPEGEVLIASKHQSFFDIILLCSVLPRPKFIMKASLKWTPILGWYALRIGCVPVERGRRAEAIAQMKRGVNAGLTAPGQLIIYPQGTRVAPGAHLAYKVGTGILYEQIGQPCVPAATNVGVFWPRTGIYRKPGLAVLDFLDEIPPGRPSTEVMLDLEHRIESRSNALMREAGFSGALPEPPAPGTVRLRPARDRRRDAPQ